MQSTDIFFAHPLDYILSAVLGIAVLVHAGLRYAWPAFFRRQPDDQATRIKNFFWPIFAAAIFV